jgi:glycosyltransferase involved in cell wall biosynthesis
VREVAKEDGIPLVEIPMERAIKPISDLRSLFQVYRFFRKYKPDMVNAGTPKAGLLCIVAAFLCRIKARIYTLRGLRYESESGFFKWFLMKFEYLTCIFAKQVICISPSVGNRAIQDRILKREKIVVIGKGSSNGVDLERFFRNPDYREPSETIAEKIGIKSDDLVVGFVGRLVTRKGIIELTESWKTIRRDFPESKLLIVGPLEAEQQPPPDTLATLENDDRVILTGYVPDVELYFYMMDLFVLPAYWEGFGNVLIQAAAMEIPIVSTQVTGCKDAVSDGFNGTLVPAYEVDPLTQAIGNYLKDPELRKKHGKAGKTWARNFEQEEFWGLLADFLKDLAKKG